MRLIDADSLKKHWNVDPNAMFKPASIIKTIDREPTAASGKWISVEDELPALDERVFFITGLYDLKIGYTHYTEENEADLDAPLPVFQDDEDHEPYFISEGDVRYWMPIPKQPEDI